MKKTSLLSVVVCIILTSCNGSKDISTVFPSVTPQPSLTATIVITPTFAKIVPTQPSSNPTFTPFPPYQNKNVVFDYYVIGNRADWDIFFDPPSGNIVTRLVLYEDGQMLAAGPGGTYKEKFLSSAEIKSFLSKLETLGFYSLESNQQSDQTDKLYDFGSNYEEVNDGLWYCISVNANKSRKLCIREPYIQFLTPKMQSILQYLDEYKPTDMTPYYTDRILLTIQSDINSSIKDPPAIPWDEHFPSLEHDPRRFTSDTSNQVIYVAEDMAKEIYLFFEGSNGWKVVSQNSKEYIVYIRVLLPHEKVKNIQQ